MVLKWAAGALGAFACMITSAPWARAQNTDVCASVVTRSAVVACALRASPAVYGEMRGLDALSGRRTAAGVVLPANPSLALTLGRRQTEPGALEASGTTWSAALSQEIEIAGQRGTRLDAVTAEQNAQRQRIVAVEREAASAALYAYFDALAAQQELVLSGHLVELARALTVLARGRAEAGVGSAVEADLADAVAVRLAQARFTAERRVQATNATLTTLLGQDPTRNVVRIDGELEPLRAANDQQDDLVSLALSQRADLAVAEAERQAQDRRTAVLRRSRIPNPSLSIFAQSDRVNERVFGVGLTLPLPLPAPIGRTYAGEIAEAEALTKRAEADVERVRRSVLLEVATASATLASRKRELVLFNPERITRAEGALSAIARELEARRLSVRDALLAQQTLVELLQASIESRRQLCLASVELARVAGVAFEGGAQ